MKQVMRCPSVCGPVKWVPLRPLAVYLKSTVYSKVQIPVDFVWLLVRTVAMKFLRASNEIFHLWYLYFTPLNYFLNHLPLYEIFHSIRISLLTLNLFNRAFLVWGPYQLPRLVIIFKIWWQHLHEWWIKYNYYWCTLSYPYLCTNDTILRKNPTDVLYLLVPLYSHYTLLHAPALKEASSWSIDTLCEQGHQNTYPDIKIKL